ncbi:MAG: hypothetical protein EOO40_04500 [Deltaproteobacteria bacterium]|nr:MAG: hypothetical protein EOO40_04500 [Deltaproteobacteria bacterium]
MRLRACAIAAWVSCSAPAAQLDMAHSPAAARDAINSWARRQTAGHIDHLLPDGALKAGTRLVPVAALHLQATWPKPLRKDTSGTSVFHQTPDTTMHPSQMLHATLQAPYADSRSATAIRLAYKNPAFSLLLVMPKADLTKFAATFDARHFDELWQSLHSSRVALSMPAFAVKQSLGGLKDLLSQWGMQRAFDQQAQFAILQGMPTAITGLYEKATIRVDAQGTEAAAAAAAVVRVTAMPPSQQEPQRFEVNRPFLFFVVHDSTQTILFAGSVAKPETL